MLLETKRLSIRRFTIEDAPAVLAFGSNDEIARLTGDPKITTIAEAENIINNIWLPEYEKYGYARMAVVYKKEKKVIGFAGFKFEEEFEATDIGYRLLPQYWGKGLTTEACVPLIFYGFKVLSIPKIVGVCYTANKESANVLKKLGLKLTKNGDILGDGGDYQWYELKKEDYQDIVKKDKKGKRK